MIDKQMELINKFTDFLNLCGPLVHPMFDDLQNHFSDLLEKGDLVGCYKMLINLKKVYKVNNGDDIISLFETISSSPLSTEKIDNVCLPPRKIEALSYKFMDGMPEKQTIFIKEKIPYEETKRVTELLIGKALKEEGKTIFPFIVSNNFKKSGKICNKMTMKTPYTLLSVLVKGQPRNAEFKVSFLDDGKELYSAERYVDYLHTYYFVSYDEHNPEQTMEYTLLSRELLPLEDVEITGMKIPINDSLKIGATAKLPKGFEVVYVTNCKPTINKITFDDFKLLTAKYKNNYELLYSDYFGKFRHPPIFEKFLLGWLFSSECSYGPVSSYKPNLAIIGPSRGGKSVILDCLSTVFREKKYGEASTIKSFVPNFGGSNRPDPGNFLKSNRFCLSEEFMSMAFKNNSLAVLDTLKSLLVHDKTEATSGKFDGSGVYSAPTATFVFASNFIKPKLTDFVSLADNLPAAFLARFIIYVQSPEHVNFVKERQEELSYSKNTDVSRLLPTYSPNKIELYDFLLKCRVEFGKFNEFGIVNSVKENLPDNANIREIYNGANEHVVRLLDGITKLNYILEGREGTIVVTQKDYDDTKEVWEFIINSWIGDIFLLPLKQKIQFLNRKQRMVYDFVLNNPGLSAPVIEKALDESVTYILNKLVMLNILQAQYIGDLKYYYVIKDNEAILDVKVVTND